MVFIVSISLLIKWNVWETCFFLEVLRVRGSNMNLQRSDCESDIPQELRQEWKWDISSDVLSPPSQKDIRAQPRCHRVIHGGLLFPWLGEEEPTMCFTQTNALIINSPQSWNNFFNNWSFRSTCERLCRGCYSGEWLELEIQIDTMKKTRRQKKKKPTHTQNLPNLKHLLSHRGLPSFHHKTTALCDITRKCVSCVTVFGIVAAHLLMDTPPLSQLGDAQLDRHFLHLPWPKV